MNYMTRLILTLSKMLILMLFYIGKFPRFGLAIRDLPPDSSFFKDFHLKKSLPCLISFEFCGHDTSLS